MEQLMERKISFHL